MDITLSIICILDGIGVVFRRSIGNGLYRICIHCLTNPACLGTHFERLFFLPGQDQLVAAAGMMAEYMMCMNFQWLKILLGMTERARPTPLRLVQRLRLTKPCGKKTHDIHCHIKSSADHDACTTTSRSGMDASQNPASLQSTCCWLLVQSAKLHT